MTQARGGSGSSLGGDSMALSIGTLLSRISGIARILVLPAVFGASAIGDMFLAVNALPQTFFAIFGGQALSSLLVPMMVRALDADPHRADRIARHSLGLVIAALAVVAGVAMVLHRPIAAALASGIEETSEGAGDIAAVLLLLILPQIVLYGCISVFVAVQHARGRFLLPSIAPIVENVGLVGVVLFIATRFDDVHLASGDDTALLVALGVGSTVALLAHLVVQAVGVLVSGGSVLPLAPRREPEIEALRDPARSSLAWTVFLGPRFIGLAIAAGWAGTGGIQAIQIGLLVQNLPMALIGYPIAAALLPRLSARRLGASTIAAQYVAARDLAIWALFPLSAGMIFLAGPLGDVLAAGRYADDGGGALVTMAIAGLGIAAMSEALYEIARQATLAHGTLSGFQSSIWARAALSLVGIPLAVLVLDGKWLILGLGLAVSVSDLAGLVLIDAPLRHARVAAPSTTDTTATDTTATRTIVRSITAAVVAGFAGLGISQLLATTPAVVRLVLSGGTLLVIYAAGAWLLTERGRRLRPYIEMAKSRSDDVPNGVRA